MIGMIEGLIQFDQKIELFVLRVHKLEDHSSILPIKMPKSRLMFWQKNSFEGNSLKWNDLPSIRFLMQNIRKFDRNFVVIRVERSLFSIATLFVAMVKFKTEVVLYHQRPIPEKSFLLRLIQKMMFVLLKWRWISPVTQCRNKNFNSPYSKWIPFTMKNRGILNGKYEVMNKIEIVTIGKLVKRKNLDLVIEVFQSLPNLSFQLTLVVENTTLEHNKAKIELIEKIRFNTNIEIIQNLTNQEVLDKLSKSHVFILLSDMEPASISNLEAMAFGNLVVIGKNNGTANYLDNGKGGFIVSYDKSEIIEKMRFVLENRFIIEKMGHHNIREVEKHFNPNKLSKTLIEFINGR